MASRGTSRPPPVRADPGSSEPSPDRDPGPSGTPRAPLGPRARIRPGGRRPRARARGRRLHHLRAERHPGGTRGPGPDPPRPDHRRHRARRPPSPLGERPGAGGRAAGGGVQRAPPPAALASLEDPAVLRWAGWHTAREAHGVGLNWVIAPVCDLDSEARNPIVQTRAFGAEAESVGEAAALWIGGARAGGVMTCAKHWPGHGRTTADSHDTIPVVDASAQTLRDQDETPFRAAIAAKVDGVMTAHVSYPGLDPTGTPATFSPPILRRLRDLGFDGLVATDALLMEGAAGSAGEVALSAIRAGCDILCYPTDLDA